MMSAKATKTDETKEETQPQVKTMEEESSSSSQVEPGKKKRKLNDGSSIKADEQSTGFFSSLTNFLSGSWLWSPSTPAKADVTVKAEDGTSEKATADSTKAEEATTEEQGSAVPQAETAKATDDKREESVEPPKEVEKLSKKEKLAESKESSEKTVEEEAAPKDLTTVTNSSVDSEDTDDNLEDENQDDGNELEEAEQSPSEIQNVVPDKSETPKAMAVEIRGSRKRRRLS